MSGWLIAWIAYQALSHGAALSRHGKSRVFDYRYALVGTAIGYGFLYMAGVFTM